MEFTSTSFYRFMSEGKLMGSRCKGCGVVFLPPRPICTGCHKGEMEWTKMSGKGRLAAFTTIAVGPTFMVEEGYNRENHYCSGIVELEEGPSISARILSVDTKEPENIKIGIPMIAEFLEKGQGEDKRMILAFKAEK